MLPFADFTLNAADPIPEALFILCVGFQQPEAFLEVSEG